MYVCICQAITDRQIESAVDAGFDGVDALRDSLGVASCCGSCETTAEAIVEARLSERQQQSSTPVASLEPTIYRPVRTSV